jgi:hypothetical protein
MYKNNKITGIIKLHEKRRDKNCPFVSRMMS